MEIKIVEEKDKEQFNKLSTHPLQLWEWGDFRIKTGIEVIRLGGYEDKQLKESAQITIHPIPFVNFKIGYLPKGQIPSKNMIIKLKEIGKQKNCIFIKLEPNIEKNPNSEFRIQNSVISPHPLFTKYTFQLDLTLTEEELLQKMHSKTRYNIKVAKKHGVKIIENNTDEAFERYIKLLLETTKRQGFYAHDEKYHTLMWKTLSPVRIARLFEAVYEKDGQKYILASWIVFLSNNVLYYPYGASSEKFRNTMASTLMLWETAMFGKKMGAKIYDLWGSLGPQPDPKDPWYGFHRFKQGFNPKLVEFVGSYDLVINPFLYKTYNLAHKIREAYLGIKR